MGSAFEHEHFLFHGTSPRDQTVPSSDGSCHRRIDLALGARAVTRGVFYLRVFTPFHEEIKYLYLAGRAHRVSAAFDRY